MNPRVAMQWLRPVNGVDRCWVELLLRGDGFDPATFFSPSTPGHVLRAVEQMALVYHFDVAADLRGRTEFPLTVSINVSPVTLETSGWTDRFLRMTGTSGHNPSVFVVELIEGWSRLTWQALDRLARLKDAGVRIALDDVGIQPTYDEVLQQGLVDVVKLDRECLGLCATSGMFRRVVGRAIGRLRDRGIEIVAEGVATQREHEIAANVLMVDWWQGFLGQGKPVIAAEIVN